MYPAISDLGALLILLIIFPLRSHPQEGAMGHVAPKIPRKNKLPRSAAPQSHGHASDQESELAKPIRVSVSHV